VRESFFAGSRIDFYKPLTGKYRGVVEFVLVQLYEAFFGQRYTYAHSMDRDEIRNIVLDGLQRVALMDREGEEQDPVRSDLLVASEIIRDLVRHDFLTEYLDTESMRSRIRFTLHGRNQAKFFADSGKPELKMPQRNVRNCRASLMAYVQTGDPADLISAADFARRIVHDFAEAEEHILEEQRRIISGASKEYAVKGYFDYMEKRFIPDHSIRASKDSVTRFHDQIQSMLSQLWTKPAEDLGAMERAAREARPDLIQGSEPVVLSLLNEIRDHLAEAMNHRMPRLLAAAGDFGSRASFVAMQASIVSGLGGMSALSQLGERLKLMTEQGQDQMLEAMLWDVIPPQIMLVDESLIRVRKGVERTSIPTSQDIQLETREERLEATIRRALDVEFGISIEDIRDQMLERVAGMKRSVRLSELPLEGYEDLLFLTHAVEASCASEAKGKMLEPESLGTRVQRPCIEFEDMAIGVKR
jgi:Family of unknown function (DUF5716)